MDGDGRFELVTLGKSRTTTCFKVFKHKDGALAFEDVTERTGLLLDGSRFPDFILFGDVNNNGLPDVYSAKYCEFEKPKIDPKTGKPVLDKDAKDDADARGLRRARTRRTPESARNSPRAWYGRNHRRNQGSMGGREIIDGSIQEREGRQIFVDRTGKGDF